MARAGLTDAEIADELKISVATVHNWKNKHPEFIDALKRGKAIPDDKVELSLFQRALGYEYVETTREVPKFDAGAIEKLIEAGMSIDDMPELVVTKTVTKQLAPDVTAQIFWLKNRRPDRWRDVQRVEHRGNVESSITIVRSH